jgi:hypothetical protein
VFGVRDRFDGRNHGPAFVAHSHWERQIHEARPSCRSAFDNRDKTFHDSRSLPSGSGATYLPLHYPASAHGQLADEQSGGRLANASASNAKPRLRARSTIQSSAMSDSAESGLHPPTPLWAPVNHTCSSICRSPFPGIVKLPSAVEQVDQAQTTEQNATGTQGVPDTDEADRRLVGVRAPEKFRFDAAWVSTATSATVKHIRLVDPVGVLRP